MFFTASKIIGFGLVPSNFTAILGLTGLALLLLGLPRWGRTFLAGSALLLTMLGWSPVGAWSVRLLEDRFPRPTLSGPVAGIVMLGGAVDTDIAEVRGEPALREGAERINAVAELSRLHPEARIILSGGFGYGPGGREGSESDVAMAALVALGVDADRIELEENSRNTWENAVESLKLARPAPGQQWLMITSASHMPRAVACFRAAGFAVIPYPVDYRTGPIAFSLGDSVARGLTMADLAAHEWVGLAVYRAVYTSELFPAPAGRD